MRGGIASPRPCCGDSGELWRAVDGAEVDQTRHTTPEQPMSPRVVPVKLAADTEFLQLADHVLYRDAHLGHLMVEIPVLRAQRSAFGTHPRNDHLVPGAQLVQTLIPSVSPDTAPLRQATE